MGHLICCCDCEAYQTCQEACDVEQECRKKGELNMGLLQEKTYISIEQNEYERLIAMGERMAILKDYINSADYIEKDTIKMIVGIDRKENNIG